MAETKLQLVNSTLALLGETSLTSTANAIGALVLTALNSALVMVAQQSRAGIFEKAVGVTVTNPDYLVSAYTIPDNALQVFSVLLRVSTGVTGGDKLIPLKYVGLEELDEYYSYSIVGRDLYLSSTLARPCTIGVYILELPQLPANDGDTSGIPDVVLPAVRHTAASILYASYLDDANGSAVQRRIAEDFIEKLRTQYGLLRGKSFNMGSSVRHFN